MDITNFRLEEGEFDKIQRILSSLCDMSRLDAVFLINRNGQEIARHGNADGIDIVAMSSLAASNMAATYGLANILGEEAFSRVLLKGLQHNVLISPAGDEALILSLLATDREKEFSLQRLTQASLVLGDVLKKCTSRDKVIEEF